MKRAHFLKLGHVEKDMLGKFLMFGPMTINPIVLKVTQVFPNRKAVMVVEV